MKMKKVILQIDPEEQDMFDFATNFVKWDGDTGVMEIIQPTEGQWKELAKEWDFKVKFSEEYK